MKQIKDYTDYYITENGKVYSKKYHHRQNPNCELREMKCTIHKTGYSVIELFKNKIGKSFRVHRLVAECYIPNPDNKPYVNHIDGNKSNNKLINLEWCTAKENEYHKRTVLKKHIIGSDVYGSKLNNDDVLWIRNNRNNFSTKELSYKFNVSTTSIYNILKNKTWKHI